MTTYTCSTIITLVQVREAEAMFEADTAPQWAAGEVCHRYLALLVFVLVLLVLVLLVFVLLVLVLLVLVLALLVSYLFCPCQLTYMSPPCPSPVSYLAFLLPINEIQKIKHTGP